MRKTFYYVHATDTESFEKFFMFSIRDVLKSINQQVSQSVRKGTEKGLLKPYQPETHRRTREIHSATCISGKTRRRITGR